LLPKKLAILVSGGPAPGINSVIGAATIRSILDGIDVIGIHDGFKWLMKGDIAHTENLTIEAVSRIHFRGGSFIGISRENPTKNDEHLENVVSSLLRLNVDKLITIGGDDTAYSASCVEKMANGRIHVIHVPKTIDNDLNLPMGICTFGFQTARHIGVDIVKNLMVDARTTSRWYFVISMGRKAGHLALGIGKSAGATLTLIPEEFGDRKLSLKMVVDILVGAIIKRLSYGRPDGVAVLAEGLVERMDEKDLKNLTSVGRDSHNNLRYAEINIGELLKEQVQLQLKKLGIMSNTIVSKNIGYELRCSDPIPFDMEYTRELGYCAAKFILDGGNRAMVSIQNGHFKPMFFEDLRDPETGRPIIRMVNVNSESYLIARRYMLRLNKEDFDDTHELAKLATTANMHLDEFRKRYYYLVKNAPDFPEVLNFKKYARLGEEKQKVNDEKSAESLKNKND